MPSFPNNCERKKKSCGVSSPHEHLAHDSFAASTRKCMFLISLTRGVFIVEEAILIEFALKTHIEGKITTKEFSKAFLH
jgi:hypothetical protein